MGLRARRLRLTPRACTDAQRAVPVVSGRSSIKMPRAAARSPSEEAGSQEDSEDEDEVLLAAFATSSRSASKKSPAGAASATKTKGGKGKGASPAATPLPIVPYMEKPEMEDVELCSDPDATLERHMEDTEKLLQQFERVVGAHEPIIAKAISKVEERCEAQRIREKRDAVESATVAAIHTTELRMAGELRAAVADALTDAREAARVAQAKAVAEAVKLAEERASEQQRLAVSNVTSMHQRALGRPDEEVAATRAAFNFQEAASAAAAALAAASELRAREADLDADAEQSVVDASDDAGTDAAAAGSSPTAEKRDLVFM